MDETVSVYAVEWSFCNSTRGWGCRADPSLCMSAGETVSVCTVELSVCTVGAVPKQDVGAVVDGQFLSGMVFCIYAG